MQYILWRDNPVLMSILGLILLNFMGYDIYWCYLLIPIFLVFVNDRDELAERNFMGFSLFSVLYFTFLHVNNIDVSFSLLFGYLFFPPVFYFIGKLLIKRHPDNISVFNLLIFICLFFSFFPFLANLRSIAENGFMTVREIKTFWNYEGDPLNVTNIGVYFAFNLTLLPVCFMRKDLFPRIINLLIIALFFTGLFSIINMSNRTGLLIVVVSLFSSVFVANNKRKFLLIISVILGLVGILMYFNLFNTRTWIEYSLYFERISNTSVYEEGSRFVLWKNAIGGLLAYPLGNSDYEIGSQYAHNMWLDVGRRAGIFPVIPLIFISLLTAINLIKASLVKSIQENVRYLLVGFGIAFYLTFFLEPILEGSYIFFFLFCFYAGVINGILDYFPSD
jgi:hypothetical protein